MGLTLMEHLVLLRPGPEIQAMRPSGVKAMPSGPTARELENPCPGPAWTAAQPGVAAEFAVSPAGAAGAEKPRCQRPRLATAFLRGVWSGGPAATSQRRTLRIQRGGGKGPVGPSAPPRSLLA